MPELSLHLEDTVSIAVNVTLEEEVPDLGTTEAEHEPDGQAAG